MEYKDYYKTLGVPRTASQAEIKKAFRKLARLHHPDVKPGDKAAEARFKDVNEANEVLSDPTKRKQYDELGANWEAYSRAGAGGAQGDPFGPGGPFAGFGGGGQRGNVRYEFRTANGGEFSDFFRMFFGGDDAAYAGAAAGRAGGAGAGATGSFAFTGGQGGGARRSTTSGPSIEDLMAGMGGGSYTVADGPAAASPVAAEARAELTLEEAFHGTTRLVDVDGKRLEVKLPPGVETGSRIRIKGKGPGGGDLIIVADVKPGRVFERKGADLTREVRVALREALLGGEIPVGTLKGRVLLTIPPGTQSGRMFRLTGQGMPRLKGSGTGDLYVRINVVLPASLSEEAKAAAAAFLDLANQPDPRA